MYITIAIYRQASINIRINVGQQQNWWWWGGVHKAKKNLLHFSLNHGIFSRMALFLEKLDFFLFLDPLPPLLENSNFFLALRTILMSIMLMIILWDREPILFFEIKLPQNSEPQISQ